MQKLFIALFFLGVAGWFFFDGLVVWPRSNVRFLAYEQHEKEGRFAEWPAYAKARGWTAKRPHKYYDDGAISGQFIFGGISAGAGVLLLVYWLTQRRRTFRADEEAVYTPAGSRVPFTSVTGIGKKKWEAKGLATVRYEDNGRQKQFIVDDYKFDPIPTHQILKEIETRLTERLAVREEAAAAAAGEERRNEAA